MTKKRSFKMGIFDGILICTDLDGTLLKNDKSISTENIEAIEYFKEEGGIFTFVTGRMPFFVSDICEIVKPNGPFGCINGGGLYDYNKNEYIWTAEMSDKVIELVRLIDVKFPDVGFHVNTYNKTYFCKDNREMEHFRKVTNAPKLVCDYENVGEPIAKFVFGIESDDVIEAVNEALCEHPLADEFDFIRSEKTLFEILPKGIDKGKSIEKLCEYLNIDRARTIAVGDYNNDISMLKAAKIGIAVANACDEAIAAADYVTVSNEEDAIAKIIYDLKDGKYL